MHDTPSSSLTQRATSAALALRPRPSRKRQYWRALRAIVRLARNTERTDQVFEIIEALTGDSLEATHRAFFADAYGQQLLRERTSLLPLLSDTEALRRMPEGSLGRAYLDFMTAGNITAGGLVKASEDGRREEDELDPDPDRQFIGERLRDMHDLWHVLNDYGRDDAGEIANLWFSVGQFGNPGMAFIALLGTLDGPKTRAWWRYMRRALIRGRLAKRLVCAPFEALLDQPLDQVRKRLGIIPTRSMHPDGMYVGCRKDPHGLGGTLLPLTMFRLG
jgi:ubiquinone biosynthesis protein COQ4